MTVLKLQLLQRQLVSIPSKSGHIVIWSNEKTEEEHVSIPSKSGHIVM